MRWCMNFWKLNEVQKLKRQTISIKQFMLTINFQIKFGKHTNKFLLNEKQNIFFVPLPNYWYKRVFAYFDFRLFESGCKIQLNSATSTTGQALAVLILPCMCVLIRVCMRTLRVCISALFYMFVWAKWICFWQSRNKQINSRIFFCYFALNTWPTFDVSSCMCEHTYSLLISPRIRVHI